MPTTDDATKACNVGEYAISTKISSSATSTTSGTTVSATTDPS